MVRDNVFDSGFYKLDDRALGRYLTVRRDGDHPVDIGDLTYSANYYQLNSLKAYQTPNLLQTYQGQVKIASDTSAAKSIEETAENLLINLDNRTCAHQLPPNLNAEGDSASYKSCFISTKINMVNNQFVFGVQFPVSVFMHAILVLPEMR